MPFHVFVAQPIDARAIAWLRQRADVVCGFGSDAVALEDVIGEIEGLLVRSSRIKAPLVARATRLRVISRWGVGYDNIDVAAATRRGIPVLITGAANSRAVAEYVIGAAISVYRNFVRWDADVRRGRFDHRDDRLGHELSGRTLGVVGLGRIGTELVRIARVAFDMPALAYHPRLSAGEIAARGATAVEDLQDLARRSDVFTIHLPLTAETRGLVDGRVIGALRHDAIVVNTSRGGILDEQALATAILGGRVAGAAIDVYDQEPPPPDHPLLALEQVLLTPHNAAHTHETFLRMSMDAATEMVRVLEGQRPRYAVNAAALREEPA